MGFFSSKICYTPAITFNIREGGLFRAASSKTSELLVDSINKGGIDKKSHTSPQELPRKQPAADSSNQIAKNNEFLIKDK